MICLLACWLSLALIGLWLAATDGWVLRYYWHEGFKRTISNFFPASSNVNRVWCSTGGRDCPVSPHTAGGLSIHCSNSSTELDASHFCNQII